MSKYSAAPVTAPPLRFPSPTCSLIIATSMFLKATLFAVTLPSAVWAQFSMAQCGSGFDWVSSDLQSFSLHTW